MSPWLFLRFLFLPALVVAASLFGGWLDFSVPVICFIIHPLLNFFSKKKSSMLNTDTETHDEHGSKSYRLVPFLFVPVLIGMTAWSVILSQNN